MPADNVTATDVEETKEEAAARRIEAASARFGERADLFAKTLRANARDLTPYKREMLKGWLGRHCERLNKTVTEADAVPPLGLTDLPDDLAP